MLCFKFELIWKCKFEHCMGCVCVQCWFRSIILGTVCFVFVFNTVSEIDALSKSVKRGMNLVMNCEKYIKKHSFFLAYRCLEEIRPNQPNDGCRFIFNKTMRIKSSMLIIMY